MRNNYALLNELSPTIPFREPPILCGMYTVWDEFKIAHQYHFRRMPRAIRYTGRYGVFYHHPDIHWMLVGWVDDNNQFQRPYTLLKEHEKFLTLFVNGPRRLDGPRCAWCGRKMGFGEPPVHPSEACSKNLQSGEIK